MCHTKRSQWPFPMRQAAHIKPTNVSSLTIARTTPCDSRSWFTSRSRCLCLGSSADYVSASSTSSYAHSIASSSFTLYYATSRRTATYQIRLTLQEVAAGVVPCISKISQISVEVARRVASDLLRCVAARRVALINCVAKAARRVASACLRCEDRPSRGLRTSPIAKRHPPRAPANFYSTN